MQITSVEKDGVMYVAVVGRLTVGSESAFKTEMDVCSAKVDKIVLDCSKMEYIDSTGLGLVVRFYKDFTSKGGKMVLAALQPKPKLVFDITRAYKIFEIFDSIEQASGSFKD